MLFRSCCIGLKHYTKHVFAGFVILAAVVLNMIDITEDPTHTAAPSQGNPHTGNKAKPPSANPEPPCLG